MTNSQKTHIYTSLSIQVRLDGLSFFTQNSNTKEIGVYDIVRFREKVNPTNLVHLIQEAFQNHPALSKNFAEVTVIYDNRLYTVVPLLLFDHKRASDFLKFNTKILSTDFIAYDEIKDQDKVVVYVPYTNVNNYFFDRFGNFNYYHTTTLFLKYLSQEELYNLSTTSTQAFAYIKEQSFDLAITKNGKLSLINSYTIRSEEDFLYYLLFAYEQLNLDPDETPFTMLGKIDTDSSLYKSAYRYIRNCTIVKQTSPIIQNKDLLLATLL